MRDSSIAAAVTLDGNDFNFPLFERIGSLEGTITGTLTDGNTDQLAVQTRPGLYNYARAGADFNYHVIMGFLFRIGLRRRRYVG